MNEYNYHHPDVGEVGNPAMATTSAPRLVHEPPQDVASSSSSSSSLPTQLPKYAVLGPGGVITSASPRDVLNGRGQGVQRHPGNVKYRTLVVLNKVRRRRRRRLSLNPKHRMMLSFVFLFFVMVRAPRDDFC